jgi:agmatine deiminase
MITGLERFDMPVRDGDVDQRTFMPPEWAPHEATWLSWPHNKETWPAVLQHAEVAMTQVVAALAPHEHVHINVLGTAHREHVARLLRGRTPPGTVSWHTIPTNDAWIRDHGAIFAFSGSGERVALDFGYNAWGGKYPPWDDDQKVASAMARVLGVPVRDADFILEGGSLDVNGAGAVLTTEQCLLNTNRNPTLSRAQIEARLGDYLGVDEVLWLGDGILGDDTDGHIDDLTRFVNETTIVTVVEADSADPNFGALQENRRRLEGLRISGRTPDIVELPMPEALFAGSERLPASYANFYIANEVVLLPVFASPRDGEAAALLAACMPDRQVVQIDARALVHGLGGIHCLTQQVPAADPLLSCPRVFSKVTGSHSPSRAVQ